MKWIPKVLSLIFLWGSVAAVVIYVEPELIRDVYIQGMYLPFLVLLSIAIWYTFAIVVRSASISLLFTLTIIAGLILTMLQLMHWGLALVLLLTLVMESWYTYHRYEKIHTTNEQKDRGAGL